MGKAANNEKRKLKATFYNNLATAGVITACVGPYISLLNITTAIDPFSKASWISHLSTENLEQFAVRLTVGALVFLLAFLLRKMAEEELDKITQ